MNVLEGLAPAAVRIDPDDTPRRIASFHHQEAAAVARPARRHFVWLEPFTASGAPPAIGYSMTCPSGERSGTREPSGESAS